MTVNNENDLENWLCELFGGEENIPTFERNPANFLTLKKVMDRAKADDLGKTTISNTQEAQIEDLKNQTAKMTQQLNGLGLEVQLQGVPGTISSLVDVIAQTSEMLKLDDPGEASMNNAISNLRFKASKVPLESHLKKLQHRKDTKDYIEDSSICNKTEQALNGAHTEMVLNKEALIKTRKKSAFMQEKQREYLELQDKYVTIIRKNGFQKQISHDFAEDMQKNIQGTQEELEKIDVKLEAFKGLPASLELASAKLAEKEKVLQDLNDLLQREIQQIHL